jgi:hypothetical protein
VAFSRKVALTGDEALTAAIPAVVQVLRRVHQGRSADHGGISGRSMPERFGGGINGYMGQHAASKGLNRYFVVGGHEVSDGDLGPTDEARTTHHSPGHLLVYEGDKDHKNLVAVFGQYPEFVVYDPIPIKDLKRKEFWNSDMKPPCYYIPRSFLDNY